MQGVKSIITSALVGNQPLIFPQVVRICHSVHITTHQHTIPPFIFNKMQVFHSEAVDGDLYFAKSANPHLPPPQPIYVVVGLYIDRCIIRQGGVTSVPSVLPSAATIKIEVKHKKPASQRTTSVG